MASVSFGPDTGGVPVWLSRSQRSRRGASILLVVAAVAGALTSCRSDDSAAAPPDTSAVTAVPEGMADRCPRGRVPLPFPRDGVLPDGAIGVRLCSGAHLRTDDGFAINPRFDAPLDVLTTDVEGFVAVVDALPPTTRGKFCNADAGPEYVYWFLYAGGDARAVSYDAGGCDEVSVAPDMLRSGGQDLQAAFEDALLSQRATLVPPGSLARPGCNPNDTPETPFAHSADLAFASLVYCPLPDGSRWREARLADADVAAVNNDLSAHYGRVPRTIECGGEPNYAELKGYTVWGDFVRLSGSCLRFDQIGNRQAKWVPSPPVARMLADLPLGPPQRQCSITHRFGGNGCPR